MVRVGARFPYRLLQPPVDRERLIWLLEGILFEFLDSQACNLYINQRGIGEFEVRMRRRKGEELRRLFKVDAAYMDPLIGLILHLANRAFAGEGPLLSEFGQERMRIYAQFESKIYEIPVLMVINPKDKRFIDFGRPEVQEENKGI